MKRKTTLFLNIALLSLSICAMVIGVVSAKTVKVNLSGSVAFKAYNAVVEFQGKIEGAQINNTANTYYIQSSANTSPTTTPKTFTVGGEESVGSSVSFGNLAFTYKEDYTANDIVFTFTMTNKSEYAISASIDVSNINLDSGILYRADEYMVKIAKDATATIKLTLTSYSLTKIDPVEASSKIGFTFEKYSVPSLTNSGFTGIINSSAKTITLTGVPAKTSSSDTLTIPGYLSDDSGNLCRVTTICQEAPNLAALTNLTGYRKIIISEGVTTINRGIYDCTSLTQIVFPSSLRVLDYNALGGCTSLTSLNFLNSVGFQRGACSNVGITSLVLPVGSGCSMSTISGCSELTVITLGNRSTIGINGISSCNKLTTLILDGNVTFATTGSIEECPALTNIYIKTGCTVPDYVSSNFTQSPTTDKTGFDKWVKNS